MKSTPVHRAPLLLLFSLLLGLIAGPPASADTIIGGTISTDTTWTAAGSPYIVTSSITVKGTDGADGITTLTIEPGVELRFNNYQQLNVGASSGDPGALKAQGTAADPIVFTSSNSTPAPGNWRGIKFYNTTDDATTIMEHCTVQYAGYGSQGQVYVYNSAPSLSNCTFTNSSNYDLYYSGTVGGTVSGCTLNSGIYLLATSAVDFDGNTFNQNNSYPIITYADYVHSLANGNTFANLDADSYIQVNGGTLTKDATWTGSIPYLISSSVTVKGTDGVDGITTLTIEPGAELRINNYQQLNVGASSGDPGALNAQGTAADPIVFTSSNSSPAPGNWRGIKFYNTTADDLSVLSFCVVEYAGYDSQGLVYLYNAKPSISYSNFRYSSHAGVYAYGAGCNDAAITGNTFSDNAYGVFCTGSALPLIHQNNFTGNSSYGVYNSSSATVNAENNWWGDPAGPNTGGDATYGNVDADPWSTEVNQIGGTSNLPDLIVTELVTDPPGNLQSGQTVTLIATIRNSGSSSVTSSFAVDFKVDGSSIGTATVNDPVAIGGTVQASQSWVYTGGDPTIDIHANSQSDVAESDDTNNTFTAALFDIADNTAPVLVSTVPADSEQLTQVDQIVVTLSEDRNAVDDAAVAASFSVVDENAQNISGTVSESNDTFTFVPDSLPLSVGNYQVSLTAADTVGNTQNIAFGFELLPEPTPVGGTISTDTTWTVDGSPYIVTSDITILGTDGADGVTTLTIEPGVTVKFDTSRSLKVGAASGDPGALVARGTAANPITFTSNQETPAPGDWFGIKILNTSDDATTRLEHCVVAYPGKSGYAVAAAIATVDAAPTLANCRFIHGYYYDLTYSGTVGGTVSGCTFNSGISLLAASSVDFTGNTFNYNPAYPTKANADDVHSLVNGNTFENLDADSYLEINSGSITKDSTWTAAIPIYVRYDLTVQGTDGADAITTLTIEPGATLRFGTARSLFVGAASGDPGVLVAQGTAANPITFTSNQSTPAAGDWYGIKIRNTSDDATTRLENCVVEYSGKAGYSVAGAVQIRDAAPTVINCTFNNNYYGAVRMQDAAPTLANCTFNNSNYYDLYYYGTVGGTVSGCTLNSGIYMQIASPVNFTGNTFNYNNEYPISVYADNVHGLVNGNTFANLDAASYLKVSYGSVTQDATWTSVIPFQIQSDLTVQGTDGADAITTLTIEPGATLRFGTNKSLSVGAASGDPGALVVQGTAANPITFTSNQATPAPGDWFGIKILNTSDDATTRLENCVVQYSGKAGYTIAAAVQITDASPALINCTFDHNYDYDLKYSGTVGGTVSGCTINNGIKAEVDSPVNFTGNTFNYNNNYPFLAYADNVHGLVNGNTFANLDAASYLKVSYGNVTRDATWTSVIPVQIQSNLTVLGTDGTDEVTTLTVAPGARLKFWNARSLNIGASAGDPGALIARGTSDQMILFTSYNSVPAPGDWNGITFAATASESSIIDYCVVEYAGSNSSAIYLSDHKISLRNSILRNNTGIALYAKGTNFSGSEIRCNTFEDNSTGIYITSNSSPNIEYNNFINNTNYGVWNQAATIVAENNWWNDDAGPNQGGDKTAGNVDAAPWSTAVNQCSTSSVNSPPYAPIYPSPIDNAVRVNSNSSINLTWTSGDPDAQDKVVYDVYIGTAADTLTLEGQDAVGASHVINNPTPGITYFWQVVAKDNHGAETTGPVWCFTASGDDPDLTIGNVVTNPAGNFQSGQNVIIRATVQNSGTGPMVDSFAVDFKVDGISIGTPVVTDIMLAGQNAVVSVPWSYAGGNPAIEIQADSQQSVAETDEQNNQYSGFLYDVADMTAPVITSTTPPDSAYLQQVNTITATLADTQSTVDDAAVIAGFGVANSNQQSVPGIVTETNDTFTFVPEIAPLADGTYTVSLTAADIYGNTQNYSFVFAVDSQPPAKPVITGGTVASGTIQVRPVQNTADQFVVQLTGTRESDTSVLANGIEIVSLGDAPWSAELNLQVGDNALEVWLVDRAGNHGSPEWVDIHVSTTNTVYFNYDASGRVKRIDNTP